MVKLDISNTAILHILQKQLATLIHPVSQSLTVKIMESQVEGGCSDCGLFATANTFTLCKRNDHSTTHRHQHKMRYHRLVWLKPFQIAKYLLQRSDYYRLRTFLFFSYHCILYVYSSALFGIFVYYCSE